MAHLKQGSSYDGAFVDTRNAPDVYMNCSAPRTLGSSRHTRISLLRASSDESHC